MNQNSDQLSNAQKSRGCGTIFLFAFLAIWVIVISGIDVFVNWTIEQSLFENATGIPDYRWINHLVCTLLLFVTLLVTYFLAKNPRLKISLRVWTLAAGFSLLTTPIKMLNITGQQETAVLQILAMFIFLVGVHLFQHRSQEPDEKTKKNSFTFGLAAVIGAGMTIPWLMWGALGSIVDTILNLLLGIVFGFMVVQIVFPYLFEKTQTLDRELKPSDFLLDGFVAAVFLVIMTAALAQNGSQIMLIITLPISGWLLTLFSMAARGSRDQGKASVALIAGLAFALPLIWFDMDELSVLIAGASGGTLEWATKAAWFTFSIPLLVLMVMAINFRFINRIHLPRRFNWILPFLSVTALAAVYFTVGQPGFFGEKVFVVMKTQADLAQVSSTADVSTRRQMVYADLVQTAEESQKAIRAQLDQWHLSYTPYYLVNGLEVNAGPYNKLLLSKRADVVRVLDSPHLRPLHAKAALTNSNPADQPTGLSWNLEMIGVDQVRNEFKDTGKGIIIGQTDTGVDGRHPELAASYRGTNGGDDYNWLDPWNNSPFPTDVEGHGTATLGIITGKDIGIAPDAQWIGCVNLARNLGNPAEYLNCMQFMLAPYPQGGNPFSEGMPSMGAMIVNNSWGCPVVEGCDSQTFESAANALETAGVFMSVAAGNTGYYGCNTVTDPLAIYSEVLTVGSIDQKGEISAFSSMGPVNIDGKESIKPDLLAPGEDITSSFPGDAYTTASGTSFAAPHVTGVVALMWSANPALIGNIELTKKILEETAKPYQGTIPECVTNKSIPNNAAGYGILDAYAAVKSALAIK